MAMTEDKLWEEILLLQKDNKKLRWQMGALRQENATLKLENANLLMKENQLVLV